VELTPAGEAAFVFLVQSRETLNRGTMVLEGEKRRALDLFMHPLGQIDSSFTHNISDSTRWW
jgi:hypothetical protein